MESGIIKNYKQKITSFFQLNAYNMFNINIYHQLPPTCFGDCYTIFGDTIALLAQKLYVFAMMQPAFSWNKKKFLTARIRGVESFTITSRTCVFGKNWTYTKTITPTKHISHKMFI